MPTQTPSLNIKAKDGGWQGRQIQLYTCAECGAQVSGAATHSAWHDSINNAINNAYTAINQEANGRVQGDQGLQGQINALAARVP